VASAFVLLGLILIVGLMRGQSALIMIASLLLVSLGAFSWWSRTAGTSLRYERACVPARIFPGERTHYVVQLSNDKMLPLPWVRVEEHLPDVMVAEPPRETSNGDRPSDRPWQRARMVALGWHERLELRHAFTCTRRGEYRIGPTNIETGDPLGLFPVHIQVPETLSLLVYPRTAAVSGLLSVSAAPFGTMGAKPPALEDPARFAGLRDYQPGDPRRWVDWKASARRLKLQTRVFTPTTVSTRIVALNVQTMPFTWQGYDAARLEAAIGVAASLIRDSILADEPVGLAANSSGVGMEDFQVFLRPNRRPSQLEDALAALARLSPLPTMAFGSMLRRIAANFPYGASLLAVTPYIDEAIADDLSRAAHSGHAVSLVLVETEIPPYLDPKIHAVSLPEVEFEEPTLGETQASHAGTS
jgi:uncharacterized protein (DUF58 family)